MFRSAEPDRNGYKYHASLGFTPSLHTSFTKTKTLIPIFSWCCAPLPPKPGYQLQMFEPNQTSLSAQKPFFLARPSKKISPIFDVSLRSRLRCKLSKRPFQQTMTSKLMAARTMPSSVCDIKNGLAVFDVCSRLGLWGIKHSSLPLKSFLPIFHSA